MTKTKTMLTIINWFAGRLDINCPNRYFGDFETFISFFILKGTSKLCCEVYETYFIERRCKITFFF